MEYSEDLGKIIDTIYTTASDYRVHYMLEADNGDVQKKLISDIINMVIKEFENHLSNNFILLQYPNMEKEDREKLIKQIIKDYD